MHVSVTFRGVRGVSPEVTVIDSFSCERKQATV